MGNADASECHVAVRALQTFRTMDRSFPRRTGKIFSNSSCRASGRALLMVLKRGRRQTQTQMTHSQACLSLLEMTSPDLGYAY